jgi:S-adenosylmethionine:tRNA-ribosyltransferase-isomerase (queuine synthetase)
MSKVFEKDGYKFVIFSDDHEPAHVHVKKAGNMVKIKLDTGEGIQILSIYGKMKIPEIVKAKQFTAENSAYLLQQWRRIHDN